MVQKKIPMRQCLGCREMKPKKELLRIVRSPEGEIAVDFKGKAPGRGAYICRSTDCLKRLRKARALSHAFGAEIPDELYDVLLSQMEEGGMQDA